MYFQKRKEQIIALGFNPEQIDTLENFVEFLWEANSHLNLVSRKMTFEELVDNHVIDCLLPLIHLPTETKLAADFGSGGGLPGVVYAIHFQKTRFRLYEKSRLKQDYLRQCQQFTKNFDVLGEIPEQLGQIEVVYSRAFKPISTILNMSPSFYKKGGIYYLLKARKEKIDEEVLEAKKEFKDLSVSITPLKSPVLDVERHLVKVEALRS